MNPLNNNSIYNANMNNISNQYIQSAKQLKSMINLSQGNLSGLFQMNPQLAQMANMFQGMNPEQLRNTYYTMCNQQGIDPNLILREFQ